MKTAPSITVNRDHPLADKELTEFLVKAFPVREQRAKWVTDAVAAAYLLIDWDEIKGVILERSGVDDRMMVEHRLRNGEPVSIFVPSLEEAEELGAVTVGDLAVIMSARLVSFLSTLPVITIGPTEDE